MAQRDPWLDNVKMTLVTLVVVGHLWGQLTLGGAGQQAYDWLYAWHIPAFVLITGHLSRRFEWTRKHLLAAVTTLLVPYLIFEPAMYYFRILFGGERESGPLYLQPHWTMWYLVVLFVWRMLTPILKSHWIFVPLSVPVSLVGGSIDVWLFDLPRILGLLPFFVMGLHLEPHHLKALTSWWARVLGVAALAWLWVLAGHTDDLARTAFLYYDRPYTDLGFSEEAGLVVRLSLLGMACLGTVGGLSLIPTKGGWFTRLGVATMVVYLFHGFVVRALQYSGILGLSEERPVLLWSVMTPFGVLIALVLASPPVSRRLGVLTDPVGAWSRRRRRLEAPTSA